MALKRGIVSLEEFNNDWFWEYEKEKKFLGEKLGDLIVEIEHVGSTSIKGLQAKPIIDILVAIRDFDEIKKIEEILLEYGYHNMGNRDVDGRFFFAKGPDDARTHYIHFVLKNNKPYYSLVLFKRYLNDHPEYIEKYCELKKKLAKMYPNERSKYTSGKSIFIDEVIRLAKEEYGIN